MRRKKKDKTGYLFDISKYTQPTEFGFEGKRAAKDAKRIKKKKKR